MLEKALLGKYDSAEDMRKELIDILSKSSNHSTSKVLQKTTVTKQEKLDVYSKKQE